MEKDIRKASDRVVGSILYPDGYVNIAKSERIVSAAFGTFMFWKGAKEVFSNPSNAVWELIIGGALLYRGATGYCAIKEKMDGCGCVIENAKVDIESVIETM